MRCPTVLLALVTSVLLASCGTGVFTHRFEIAISDPGGRLGPPPYELSVFDPQMGRSEEWARQTMGLAAPGSSLIAAYDSVGTKMMFDSTPASRVTAALWLPAYRSAGYFALMLEPTAGAELTSTLPFVPWSDSYSDGGKVVPLTARVRCEAGDGAWILHVTLDIP